MATLGPDYSPLDSILTPSQRGVNVAPSIESVKNAVDSISYYNDVLLKTPLGLRYWTETGFTCSNGAKMYRYNDTVPKGLTNNTTSKGLFPGMIEDAFKAVDVSEIGSLMSSSGFPQCKWEERPVGDQSGRIEAPDRTPYIVDMPQSVLPGSKQGRWVFEKWISEEEWQQTPKTFCADGYKPSQHDGNTCSGSLKTANHEPFQNSPNSQARTNFILLTLAGLGIYLILKKKA